MSAAAAHVQDQLLDFAYGELGVGEAHAIEVHVSECASCRTALEEIRGVRQVMAKLPQAPAPQAGLESLLAYADQAARRVTAGAPPKQTWWRRWLVPVSGLAAVVTFGIVANEVSRAPDLQNPRDRAIAEKLSRNQKVAEPVASAAPAPMKDEDFSGRKNAGKLVILESGPSSRALDRAAAEHPRETGRLESGGRSGAPPLIGEARGQRRGNSQVGTPGSGVGAAGAPSEEARAKKKVPKKAALASPEKSRTSEDDGFASQPRSDAQMELNAHPARRFESPSAPPSSVGQGALNAEAKREPVKEVPTPERASRSESSPKPPVGPAVPRAPASAMKSRASVASAELPAPSAAPVTSRDADVVQESEAMALRDDATRSRAEELSQKAIAAQREGSRAREAQYLREALATGVADRSVLTDLLLRLCEAELAVGRITEGRAACERVLREFPGTRAAQAASRRLEQSRAGRIQPAQPVEMTR